MTGPSLPWASRAAAGPGDPAAPVARADLAADRSGTVAVVAGLLVSRVAQVLLALVGIAGFVALSFR